MVKRTSPSVDGPSKRLPLSDVVQAGDLLFVSGIAAWDAAAGAPAVEGIEAQTKFVLERIKAILESKASSLDNVVKMTVYLTDRGDFQPMNRVYREYFPGRPPARATVGVVLMEPGLLVEIDAVALAGTAGA